MNLTFYGNFLSQPSRTIGFLMDYIDIEYKFENTEFNIDSLKFLSKYNPQKKLPTLVSDNEGIYESTAIARFISRKHKNDLYPIDDLDTILKIEEYFNIHHTKIRKITILVFLELFEVKIDPIIKESYVKYNMDTLEYIENILLKNNYWINNKLTIADIFLANEIFQLNLIPYFKIDKFPKIIEYLNRIKGLKLYDKWLEHIKLFTKEKNIKLFI